MLKKKLRSKRSYPYNADELFSLQGGQKKVRKTFVLYSVSLKISSMKFGPQMWQDHEIILVKYSGPCDLSFGVM